MTLELAVMAIVGAALFGAGLWLGDRCAAKNITGGVNIGEGVRFNLLYGGGDSDDPKSDGEA